MRHLIPALLVWAGLHLVWAGAAAAEDYARALDALNAHSKGFGINDSKQARDAQAALWQAAQAWTIRYLAAHPAASPAELAKASEKGPRLSAIVLNAKTLLVATQFGETGNVFAVARGPKGFAVAWDIAKTAARKRFAALAAWSLGATAESCRQRLPKTAAERCGPLFAGLLRLPNDASGNARFAIDATYAEEMGSEVGKQLSVWRWNGHGAEPLLEGTYEDVLDDDAGVRVENGLLLARQKHAFKIVNVSAPDPGRATDWVVRLAPDKVEDLGMRDAAPEMAVVDDVVWALLEGRRDPRLSAKAAGTLKRVLGSTRHFDELVGDNLVRTGGTAKVCFNLDDFGPLWFALIPSGKTFSVVEVTRGNGKDCAPAAEK